MYATAQDLQDRYPEQDLAQLSDPSGVSVMTGTLTLALRDASDEIDGYLMGRYSLPLQQVPAVLTRVACDIAMYRLSALRPQAAIEDVRSRYVDAVKYLEKVSTGVVQLGLSAEETAPAQGSSIEVVSPPRLFSRSAMEGF